MVKHAIIMAGGEGVRLRPLTQERPKPILPLLDETVIGMALRLLHRHGIRDVTIALCYRAADIRRALGDGSAYGMHLHYCVEEAPRGTAGCVKEIARHMEGPVLVLSGDGLTDADLTGLYERHCACGAMASMAVKQVEHPQAYGVVKMREDGRITCFEEKPAQAEPGSLVNTGIYFLEPQVLCYIPDDGCVDFGRDVFPAMVRAGARLHGLVTDAYWCDIGSPQAYAQAQMDLLQGKVGLPVRGRRYGQAIIGGDCAIAGDVRVTGRCYVGRNAVIDRGAVLGAGTVIHQGVQVGCNVHMERACLWENTRVAGGCILKNVVVMPPLAQTDALRVVPFD